MFDTIISCSVIFAVWRNIEQHWANAVAFVCTLQPTVCNIKSMMLELVTSVCLPLPPILSHIGPTMLRYFAACPLPPKDHCNSLTSPTFQTKGIRKVMRHKWRNFEHVVGANSGGQQRLMSVPERCVREENLVTLAHGVSKTSWSVLKQHITEPFWSQITRRACIWYFRNLKTYDKMESFLQFWPLMDSNWLLKEDFVVMNLQRVVSDFGRDNRAGKRLAHAHDSIGTGHKGNAVGSPSFAHARILNPLFCLSQYWRFQLRRPQAGMSRFWRGKKSEHTEKTDWNSSLVQWS